MDHIKLTVDKLSVEAISDLVLDSGCGAVSVFVGTTRDNFQDKKVVQLEYEAYEPMAIKALKGICEEVRKQWPDVHSIAIYHRLGIVPCREASVVIAVSSPHRREALDAVSLCIEQLKANVPIWKKEVYAERDGAPQWKENRECKPEDIVMTVPPDSPQTNLEQTIDKNLVQINVSNEELEQRIQNFIQRKREQVNLNNIHDFIPSRGENETEDTETCVRVRTQFVRRSDSKGHLKIRKVYNEYGPQTVSRRVSDPPRAGALPTGIAERVQDVERFLNVKGVGGDVFKRLKALEDRIAELQAVSPEYAQFWKNRESPCEVKQMPATDYAFSADDIAHKIELLQKQRAN